MYNKCVAYFLVYKTVSVFCITSVPVDSVGHLNPLTDSLFMIKSRAGAMADYFRCAFRGTNPQQQQLKQQIHHLGHMGNSFRFYCRNRRILPPNWCYFQQPLHHYEKSKCMNKFQSHSLLQRGKGNLYSQLWIDANWILYILLERIIKLYNTKPKKHVTC